MKKNKTIFTILSLLIACFIISYFYRNELKASNECYPEGGNCWVWYGCPEETQVCGWTPEGACDCIPGCWVDFLLQNPPEPASLFNCCLSGSGGGPSWWTIGNIISARQKNEATLEVHHSEFWGSGMEQVGVNDTSFTIKITGIAEGNPNIKEFEVIGLNGHITSFNSIALDGLPTGENYIVLENHYLSIGTIDTNTGDVHATIYAKLINDIFPPNAPAGITGHMDAKFDLANRTLALGGLAVASSNVVK